MISIAKSDCLNIYLQSIQTKGVNKPYNEKENRFSLGRGGPGAYGFGCLKALRASNTF
jgi:hypothetical protein